MRDLTPRYRKAIEKRMTTATAESKREKAMMGRADGTLYSTQTGYIWVTLKSTGQPIEVLCRKIPPALGTLVFVGYNPLEFPKTKQVLCLADDYPDQVWMGPDSAIHAAETHRFGQRDCDWLEPERLLWQCPVPVVGENKTDFYPHAKYTPVGWLGSQYATRIDYSAQIPTSGVIVCIVTYTAAGAIAFRNSSVFDLRSDIAVTDWPALTAGDTALYGIYLAAGMTESHHELGNDDYIDLRLSGAYGASTAGAGITQLTGEVTAGPGSGSQAATLTNKVTMTATAPVEVTGSPTVIAANPVDISMAAATAANDGYATAAQITKLDGIEAGAQVNNISDVDATDLTDGGETALHSHAGGGGIPAAGATTQILQWASAGVAKWATVSGDAAIADGGALAVNKTRLNVRNETGATIVSTRAVYASGFNNFPLITLADNTAETKHLVIGLTVAPIADQANGYIATTGQCDAETNAWAVGNELYLSTAGTLTTTRPTSGVVQHVGIVTVKENYPVGKILLYGFTEPYITAAPSGEDVIIRMGDSAGANKVSFRDYANAEVASINSDGLLTATITTPLPAGYIFGLTLSNNGADATNDIDIAVGKARDGSDAVDIALASALTKRLDANWSVGTNQGGLDTGAAANTTYFMWLIKRSDTGVIDVLFSASATAPTMPANYDYKRYIGAILRESGAIVRFTQRGNKFARNVMINSSIVTDQVNTAVTRTLHVPIGIPVEADIQATMYDATATAAVYFLVTDLSQTDSAASANALTIRTMVIASGSPSFALAYLTVFTNAAGEVRSRVSTRLADLTLVIATNGWIDTRGQDA